jgi:hypothetical protein
MNDWRVWLVVRWSKITFGFSKAVGASSSFFCGSAAILQAKITAGKQFQHCSKDGKNYLLI